MRKPPPPPPPPSLGPSFNHDGKGDKEGKGLGMGERQQGQRKGGDDGDVNEMEPALIEEDTSGIYEILGEQYISSHYISSHSRLIDRSSLSLT